MPTRDAGWENRKVQVIHVPGLWVFQVLSEIRFSYRGIDIRMIIASSFRWFYQQSCLAKEDPDNNASICTVFRADETGSFFKRRPIRAGQIPLSQPVVTIHNSFSGFPPQWSEVHQSRITHGTTDFLCPEGWFRRMMLWKCAFNYVSTWIHQRITSYRLP